MGNRWGIPPEVESMVKQRDLVCVYAMTDLHIKKIMTFYR